MGSHMKRAIFEEQTAKALRKWQKAAKERKKSRKAGAEGSSQGFKSGETTPAQGSSPIHLLHGHKHRSSQTDIESVLNSPRSCRSDTDFSDLSETEGSTHRRNESRNQDHQGNKDEPNNTDFSFVKI